MTGGRIARFRRYTAQCPEGVMIGACLTISGGYLTFIFATLLNLTIPGSTFGMLGPEVGIGIALLDALAGIALIIRGLYYGIRHWLDTRSHPVWHRRIRHHRPRHDPLAKWPNKRPS